MTFYSSPSTQMFLPTTQYTTTGPGVFFAAPSLSGALCQTPSLTPSVSLLTPLSWFGRYGQCFNRSASVVLGVILIACGCASLAGATMILIYFAEFYRFGTGYWCGAVFVSAGGLAISAGHHRTDCLIVATCVMSGLTVAFGIVQLTLSAFALSHDVSHWQCPILKCVRYDEAPRGCHCDTWEHGAVVANSLLVGPGALAVIVGFSLFVSCLRTICCKKNEQQQQHLLPAHYIPVLAQQIQTDTDTIRKTVPIAVQVQCTPPTFSVEQLVKEDTICRNLVQENL